LAEKYEFHMVAEGHRDFRADDLLGILTDLINKGQCKGVVIILDTLLDIADPWQRLWISFRCGTQLNI
jgi:hypothetical protein